MQRRRHFYLWLILWVAIGSGIFLAMRWADHTFQSYMGSGIASVETACELLPANVSAFIYDENFRKDWSTLRKSNFYNTFRNVASLRDGLGEWKMGEAHVSSFEKWILQFWGDPLVIAFSKNEGTLYLLSPIGNREKCVEQLFQMAFSSFGEHVEWKPQRLQDHWCFEADSSYFLSSGFHIQFYPIHGVAVMAISRKINPLLPIFHVAEGRESSLIHTPGFLDFFRQGFQQNQPFGFVRLFENEQSKDNLGLEWNCQVEKERQIVLDVRLAIPGLTTTSKGVIQTELLTRLKQSDDFISTISSWEDAQVVWNECLKHLPLKWTEAIDQIHPGSWWNIYKGYWDPVLKKLGHEVFVGLGDSDIISDKYRIPFPRTILAFPFSDPKIFLRAVEFTILKCNQESEANLLIRKIVRPYGEYYEVRMGNSAWKERYGLKQLPVAAFSDGLLILASSDIAMEKVLQNLTMNSTKAPETKVEGIDLKIQMQEVPNTIRILLAALGVFSSQDENVFLSPTTMRSLSEVFALMKEFSDSHLALTYQPGQMHLHLLLQD